MSVEAVLTAFPGAEVVASIYPPELPSPSQLPKARGLVRGCTRCDLRAGCSAPVAGEGPVPTRYAVIGEGPDATEDRKAKPFIGKVGGLLRAQLNIHNIPNADGFYLNAVSCYPNMNDKPVPPQNEELGACREHMFAQLNASGAPVVLLVGAAATRVWRFGMKMERVNGRAYIWDRRWVVVPCIHPGAVAKRVAGAKEQLTEALSTFSAIINGANPLDHMDDECIRCGTWWNRIDEDGVGYCTDHWQEGQHDRARTTEEWAAYVGTRRLL